MASKTNKILITTESREVFVVRFERTSRVRRVCPQCDNEADMLTLDETVGLIGKTIRELIREIETDAFHSIETEGGRLLVCRNSLEDLLQGVRK